MWTKVASLFLHSDNQRSGKIKKNILLSVVLKGVSIFTSFILIPVTINYLNPTEYGVWLTLLSILSWISFFDIGLGNGLRNKLAEAFAQHDRSLARTYISTAFVILSLVAGACFVIFLIVNPFLNWSSILNIDGDLGAKLAHILVYIVALSCLQFILRLTGTILIANQMPAFNDLINTVANILSLICIYILTLTTEGSLFKVAFVFTGTPVITFFIAYLLLFRFKYRDLRPSLRAVDFSYVRRLLSLGVQFFIIQMACLIIFTTSNLIITQSFGPQDVTPYNIAYKYFSITTMGFAIILSPIWSAVTDAYTQGDTLWIRKTMRHLLYVFILFSLLTLVMVVVAGPVYRIWIGDRVSIPLLLSVCAAINAIVSNFAGLYMYFINGFGKLRLQLVCIVVASLIFIPLAQFLAHRMGVAGIMLALAITNLLYVLPSPWQYKKIITHTARGIWNR